MTRRIEADLFYDPDVVGIELPEDEPLPPGWEEVPEPEHPLPRLARNPFGYAAILFGMGFAAVFVQQAPFLLQLVLGAPIFEEFVKFGLALLVSLTLIAGLGGFSRPDGWRNRGWLVVALPVALAVGAGFGILEHAFSYSVEDRASELRRIAFHAGSTGLSMATLYAVASLRDPRTRWFAPLPAAVVHYVNNVSALFLGTASAVVGFSVDAFFAILPLVAIGLMVGIVIAPGPIRAALEALAAHHLPRRTRPQATASGPEWEWAA